MFVRESKRLLRRNIRANRRNYPAGHPYRKRNTRSLVNSIKLITRRMHLAVVATGKGRDGKRRGYHAHLVERGYKNARGYPYFFIILRRFGLQMEASARAKLDNIISRATRA